MKKVISIFSLFYLLFLQFEAKAVYAVCDKRTSTCQQIPEEQIPPPNNIIETIRILGCNGGSDCPSTRNTRQMSMLDTELLNLKSVISNAKIASTNTAIHITQTDFESIVAVGKSMLSSEGFYDNFVMNIGIADATNAQTWTLPANLLEYVDGRTQRFDILSPNSLPPALQVAGATHALRQIKNELNGDEAEEYIQLQIDGTEITDLGTSYDFDEGSDDNFDEEPDVELYDVPLDLGDGQTTEDFPIDENTNENYLKIHTVTLVDAFGTINTPFGNFECLRQTEITKHYRRANSTASFGTTPTYEFRRVKWITKNGFVFSASVQEEDGSHNGLMCFMELIRFVPTNTLTSPSAVKISNDSKGVAINNTDFAADESAILDINSDSLGILIPRILMANRPSSPAEGLLVYQVDNTAGFYYFDGTAWQRLSNTVSSSMSANARTFDSAQVPTMLQGSVAERSRSHKQGKGNLEKGVTFIKFDQLQDDFEDLIINIQLEGDCNGVYISRKTREGFEVKELKKGKSNVKFSWEIR